MGGRDAEFTERSRGGSQRSAANLWGFGDTIEIANSNGKIRNRMQRSRYTTEMVPHSWR